MKVYVAGPMRGYKDFNFPAFAEATAYLRTYGHEVFNPGERDAAVGFDPIGMTGFEDLSGVGFSLREALAADTEYIAKEADAILLLNGWEDSTGARAEITLAAALGLKALTYDEWEVCEEPVEADVPWRTAQSYVDELLNEGNITLPADAKAASGRTAFPTAEDAGSHTYGFLPAHDSVTFKPKSYEPAKVQLYNENAAVELGNALRTSGISAADITSWPQRPDSGKITYFSPAKVDDTNRITGEVRTTSSTGGQKGVKAERYSLIPPGPLAAVARHYGIGSQKYEDHNWRKGYEWSKSFESMMRHAWDWLGGQDIDPETKSPNLAAVVFHAFSLMEFSESHPDFDDRYRP